MASRPVYTSTAEGFRDEREIAGLRPMAEPRPRAPRKAKNPALRQVTNGIVCFCGERFGESQALEFMLHLRAEVGETMEWREARLAGWRETNRRRMVDPEKRAQKRAREREKYATDPEYRERRNAKDRERRKTPECQEREKQRHATMEYREAANARRRGRRKPLTLEQKERKRELARQRKADPEYRERLNRQQRERRAADPEYRERQRGYSRAWYERQKTEREAGE